MSVNARNRTRNERPRNSGMGWLGLVALVAVALAAVIFVSVRPLFGGSTPQEEGVLREPASTDNTTENGQDASATDDSVEGKLSDESSSTKDGKDKDASDDAAAKQGEDGAERPSAGTGQDAARIGNPYLEQTKGEDGLGDGGETGQPEGSVQAADDGTSTSGQSDGDGVAPAASAPPADAATVASRAKATWIEGEACATSVAEVGTETASGIPFTDDAPQIGLDTAWGGRDHLGDYVEIRYGDAYVTAQVVDCASYNGGPNGLLINPGVFTRLGASSVDEWGRRMVSYRFLTNASTK